MLACLLLLGFVFVSVFPQCEWTVNFEGKQRTLNLEPLQGINLTTTGGNSDFSYSICTNQHWDTLYCNTGYKDGIGMVHQFPKDYKCYILAQWNSTIQPTYSPENGGKWTFVYNNGMETVVSTHDFTSK